MLIRKRLELLPIPTLPLLAQTRLAGMIESSVAWRVVGETHDVLEEGLETVHQMRERDRHGDVIPKLVHALPERFLGW